MKKLLGILVLALLWWNVGFTQELIKIPMYVHIVEINEKTISICIDLYQEKFPIDSRTRLINIR